jgi:hypothetical protein
MERNANQIQALYNKALSRLEELCAKSSEVSTIVAAPAASTTEGVRWISVVQFVNFVEKEHVLQRQRLQMHKWLCHRFSIVDSNNDRFVSCEEFITIFADVAESARFPTARELKGVFQNFIQSNNAASLQELPFSIFSSSVTLYLEKFLELD